MTGRAREALAPLYLFCCLLLGGNGQSSWANMVLELLGLLLLVITALEPAHERLSRSAWQLLMIAGFLLVIIALQLVPIPASLWQHMAGRHGFATDYRMLGLRVPAIPLSLTPYETLDDTLMLLPPLAMLSAVLRTRAHAPTWLARALLAGILLRALLMSSGELYRWTNIGMATNSFLNADHVAILFVILLPFIAALFASPRGPWAPRMTVVAVLVTIALIVLTAALSRSLADYALAVPVLIASVLIVAPQKTEWRRPGLLVAGLLLAAAVAFNAARPIRYSSPGHIEAASVETRVQVLRTTVRAVGDFMPFGSGLGSFHKVYRLYENRDQVTDANVIHANNDYPEFALEMGLPGILLMFGFFVWWLVAAVDVWRNADEPFARAATIASAVVLAQSLVDFPIRTAAISTVFAMCLALMADRRVRESQPRLELWTTRHVVFE